VTGPSNPGDPHAYPPNCGFGRVRRPGLPLCRSPPPRHNTIPLARRFPLFWPFCVAGAIVGTAATIVTAPFVALTAPPYYYGYYGYYGRPYYAPPPYYAPRYYAPPYYYGPR